MKSRIASALAVLACVAALAACERKGSSGSGVTPPTGAGVNSSSTAPAGATGTTGAGSVAGTAPSTDAHGAHSGSAVPDGDLSSLDQQLSYVDGALSSAEPTHTADDNG